MKPVKQIADNDCIRACVASLLEFPIEQVPDFMAEHPQNLPEGYENATTYPLWWISLQKFLKQLNLFYLEIELGENRGWNSLPFNAFCILLGTTDKGVKHSIIGQVVDDKFLPVFNPHPTLGRLTAVEGVAFLVPLDPVLNIRLGLALEKIEKLAEVPRTGVAIGEIAREALQKPVTSLDDIITLNGQGPKA